MWEKWYFKYWNAEWNDDKETKTWEAIKKAFIIIQVKLWAKVVAVRKQKKKKSIFSNFMKKGSIRPSEYLALITGKSKKLEDAKCD